MNRRASGLPHTHSRPPVSDDSRLGGRAARESPTVPSDSITGVWLDANDPKAASRLPNDKKPTSERWGCPSVRSVLEPSDANRARQPHSTTYHGTDR